MTLFKLLLAGTCMLPAAPAFSQPTFSTFNDSRNHRVYKTVIENGLEWLAENFAYLPRIDSSICIYGYEGISVKTAQRSQAFRNYGALYSWRSAQALAPEGWRLPTREEWQSLGKNGLTAMNITYGGWRTDFGRFGHIGEHANFWCADACDTLRAGEMLFNVHRPVPFTDCGNTACAFSVRFVRNVESDINTLYPGEHWEWWRDPVAASWKENGIRRLEAFIRDSTPATGVMVIYRGKVLLDYGNSEECSYIASCRKSILAMLYGKYIESGIIDTNMTLDALGVDDVGGLLPIEKTAKIADLLRSRSGVYHPASNEGGNEGLFPPRGSRKPGSFFVYNNWDFNVAGFAFERLTHQSIYEAFEHDMAGPMELEDWDIKKQYRSGDTSRSRYTAYHFVFSTRDMARVGYLMLRHGRWRNRQLIPSDFVRQMTTVTTGLTEMRTADPEIATEPWYPWGYGLMWRVWDDPIASPLFAGAFTATGNMGQYITVIPSLDLVVAWKTRADYGRRTEYQTYLKFLHHLVQSK